MFDDNRLIPTTVHRRYIPPSLLALLIIAASGQLVCNDGPAPLYRDSNPDCLPFAIIRLPRHHRHLYSYVKELYDYLFIR